LHSILPLGEEMICEFTFIASSKKNNEAPIILFFFMVVKLMKKLFEI
jgi:hypothetical protein